MTDTLNITAIAGTDGIVPIRNPEGRFTIYALKELWNGTIGTKRFIPNIDDLIADTELETASAWWRVNSLNVDLIPQLEPWGKINSSTISLQDILTGPGRLTHNSTYRLYIDKSVTPYVMAVDNRLSLKGTISRFAKILKQVSGPTDLKTISAFYDNSGNLLSQNIQLELVGVSADVNRSEYTVPVCYTMEDLPDGEVVTLITYTEEGHPASITQLIVVNTSFIRHRNQAERYVTGISLISPFLSETDSHLLLLPINVPLQGLYLRAKVHYSDGSSREYPVDGTRFALLGLESYLATMVNQKLPIVLRYTPTQDEIVYGATGGAGGIFVTQQYSIRTIEAKGAYNVKLYCFPEWVGPLNGYSLRWFLYSAERNARYDVTEYVQHAVNTPGFQPKLYGANQLINVSVNLKDINPLYEQFRHAQTVQIVLWRDGTERETNWTVTYDNGQEPVYGVDTHGRIEFINYNYWKLNLGSQCATVEEWLEKLYLPMKPIFDSLREIIAPLPTHFRVRVGESEVLEKNVNQFAETFSILNGLTTNGNVYIEWIRKTPETDLELGTSGMILWDNGGVPLS